jgi:hypothetical protein
VFSHCVSGSATKSTAMNQQMLNQPSERSTQGGHDHSVLAKLDLAIAVSMVPQEMEGQAPAVMWLVLPHASQSFGPLILVADPGGRYQESDDRTTRGLMVA